MVRDRCLYAYVYEQKRLASLHLSLQCRDGRHKPLDRHEALGHSCSQFISKNVPLLTGRRICPFCRAQSLLHTCCTRPSKLMALEWGRPWDSGEEDADTPKPGELSSIPSSLEKSLLSSPTSTSKMHGCRPNSSPELACTFALSPFALKPKMPAMEAKREAKIAAFTWPRRGRQADALLRCGEDDNEENREEVEEAENDAEEAEVESSGGSELIEAIDEAFKGGGRPSMGGENLVEIQVTASICFIGRMDSSVWACARLAENGTSVGKKLRNPFKIPITPVSSQISITLLRFPSATFFLLFISPTWHDPSHF
ncbi:hypothetical protein GOP47_0014017, partial [Adiantum capillus-veneris]